MGRVIDDRLNLLPQCVGRALLDTERHPAFHADLLGTVELLPVVAAHEVHTGFRHLF